MLRFLTILVIIVLSVNLLPVSSQTVKPFSKGDRVAFVGNSITDGGYYHSYIWMFYMTRFPHDRIDIFNCGIGGNIVSDMYKRFDSDVLVNNPDYVVLTFGMNDSGYEGYDGDNPQAFAESQYEKTEKSYSLIEKKIKETKQIRNVALIGSSPYDEKAKNDEFTPHIGKNQTMIRISDMMKESAKNNNWGFVDFNLPMSLINQQGQQNDPSFSISGGDRIHPDKDGHMVMAHLFLKAQGFGGSKVSEMNIDVSGKNIVKSENCRISGLEVTPGRICFDYLANSLPYPLDTVPRWGTVRTQKDAIDLVPFMREMNQELLTIKGLHGKYRISIDDIFIGECTGEELEDGINLAEFSHTPQYQQAMMVMYLNDERYEIERRLRQYAAMEYVFLEKKGLLFADNREALDIIKENLDSHYLLKYIYTNYTRAMFPEIRQAWKEQMELLVSKIYQVNKPIVRKIEIRKIQ